MGIDTIWIGIRKKALLLPWTVPVESFQKDAHEEHLRKSMWDLTGSIDLRVVQDVPQSCQHSQCFSFALFLLFSCSLFCSSFALFLLFLLNDVKIRARRLNLSTTLESEHDVKK